MDFPDYNEDELMQIMDVMLKEREYKGKREIPKKKLLMLDLNSKIEFE